MTIEAEPVRRGRSLGTRLVASMVLVAVVVLALSYAATYVLVRKELQDNALVEPALAHDRAPPGRCDPRDRIRRERGGLAARVAATAHRPAGRAASHRSERCPRVARRHREHVPAPRRCSPCPRASAPSDLDTTQLLAGNDVSGRHGNTVFLAIPARQILRRQRRRDRDRPGADERALATPLPSSPSRVVPCCCSRRASRSGSTRRLTRPIREIERAAEQLASGDLTGRADVPPGTDADLAALGDTLNAMAAQLEASRGSQRAFLLSISHDLRTPLTSIRGYAEALADGTLDDCRTRRPQARRQRHQRRSRPARTAGT